MADNLEKYTQALANLDSVARRLSKDLMELQTQMNRGSSGDSVLNQKRQEALNALAAIRQLKAEMNSLGSRSSTGFNIGGGSTTGPASDKPPVTNRSDLSGIDKRFEVALNNIIRSLEATHKKSLSLAGDLRLSTDSQGRSIISGKLTDGATDTRNFKYFVDEVGNFGRNLQEFNRRAFINTDVGQKVMEQARKAGFTEMDLRNVRSYEQGAYSVADFRKNVGGVNVQDSMRFDRQGNLSSMIPPRNEFRSFTQGIQRDLGDLLKWTIAISAIYGPMNAVNEAIAQLIENETQLADVSVALNDEIASTSNVFDNVYAASQRAGESVNGVIEAFGQAYRAAGRVKDESQRYTTAVDLLNDSLVLSKLSTLEQTEAIDVLTAALYQTAPAGEQAADSLSRGQDLLDKWVRVSKIASVDIETLAVGVAVLGDSAETAGLSLEQLNGMIATLAETSLVSGKEAANVAKALIGNYQSDSAVKELNRLGIAVIDVSGKTRQFMDVMTDVAALRGQGLLGDEDFNRLTLALGGGGIRRQKDVAAFIENFERMQEIARAQDGSGGESSRALSERLDTVQTSATQLSNSFQNLAQGMGSEGGLLDVFSGVLDMSTLLVDSLDKLISSAGKVGPLLVGVAAAYAIFRKTDVAAGLVNNLGIAPGLAEIATGRRNVLGRPAPSTGIGSLATLPSIAAIGLPAIQNFSQGDNEEGIANLIGGALGAVAGGPAGALIGAAIAEAFVRTTLTYEKNFVDFFAGVVEQERGSIGENAQSPMSESELMTEAFKALGGAGGEQFGWFRSYLHRETSATITDPSKGPIGSRDYDQPGAFKTNLAAALDLLRKENPDLAATIETTAYANDIDLPKTESGLTSRQLMLSGDQSLLRSMQNDRIEQLRSELISGEIKPSDYANRVSTLSAFQLSGTSGTSALLDEQGQIIDGYGSIEDSYKDLLDIYASGNQEVINQLNSQVAAIEYLQDLVDNWQPGVKTLMIKNPLTGESFEGTQQDAMDLLKLSRDSYYNTRNYGAEQVRLQNMDLPSVFGSYTSPSFANQGELGMVLQEAKKRQEIFYTSEQGGNLDAETYEAFVKSLERLTTAVGEASDEIEYSSFEGIDRKFLDEVYKEFQDAGKISGGNGGGPNWSVLDATASQIRSAEARAPEYVKRLESLGYESDLTDAIYTTSDNQIVKAHGDQKVIQYLLQQILDTEKKQLQGVYNLPEGATAWVPYQSIGLWDGEEGMGSGNINGDEYPVTSDTPYSSTPGEELSMYGMDSLKDLIDSLESGSSIKDDRDLGDLKRSEPTTQLSGGMSDNQSGLINRLIDIFSNLASGSGVRNLMESNGVKGDKSIGPSTRDPLRQSGEAQTIGTKLDLKFTSTTQLIVDGRVLASIVKPYLAADMLRTNESAGTVTRTYVI